MADLDHDGHPDVLLCNPFWSSVSLLRGAPGRAFLPASELATAAGPVAARVADLEPDGFEDLVVACTRAPALTVWRGHGGAPFERRPDTPLAGAPIALALLRADSDAAADVATIEADAKGNTTLGLRLGHGDGSFAAPVPLVLDSAPLDVAALDIEADGSADLAVVTAAPAIVLLHGNGAAAFTPETIPLPGSPVAWAVHRLPAVANGVAVEFYVVTVTDVFGTAVRRLQRVARAGSGAWGASALLVLPSEVVDLALGDANGDAVPDLFALGAQVQPLLGQGTTFTYGLPQDAGALPRALRVADMDGDGHDDILTACEDTQGLCVLFGRGDAAFGAPPLFTAFAPRTVAAADVTGDGIPDILTTGGVTPVLAVHPGDGNGAFLTRHDIPTAAGIADAALADVDADGNLDFVAVTADSMAPGVVVQRGDGQGHFAAPVVTALASAATALALADFDADGRLDTAVALADAAFPSPGGVVVLHGRGDGGFDPGPRLDVGPLPVGIVAADFDADGAVDFAASFRRSPTDLRGGITVWHGTGIGFERRTDTLTGDEPRRLAAGDLDGRAGAEIVVAHSAFGRGVEPGTIAIVHDDAAGTRVVTSTVAGFGTQVPIVFDADGDGRLDVAATNAGAFTLSVWLGDGANGLGPRTDWGTGPFPIGLATADFDHDGHADLVTANGGAATATVLLQRGTVTPVLVQDWSIHATPAGASIEWRLGCDPALLHSIELQRWDGEAWTAVARGIVPARRMQFLDPFPSSAYKMRFEFATGVASDAGPFPGLGGNGGIRVAFAPPEIGARQVRLQFELPVPERVRLAVYDVRGKRLRIVTDRNGVAGWQTVIWDRRDEAGGRVARGLYWVRLEARDGTAVQRLVLGG